MTVELRHLRGLLAVVDGLSFTRAAARLGVAQPALSQTVLALERELGVALLRRTTRTVTVTDEGRFLAARLRPVMAGLDAALQDVGDAGAPVRLRVAFQAGAVGPFMSDLLQSFAAAHPDVVVELQRLGRTDDATIVRSGGADAALLRPPVDLTGLTSRVLFLDRGVVGLPVWHRLARRSAVRMADLASEPVVTGGGAPAELVDFWTVDPRPDGSRPMPGPAVRSNEEMLEHTALGHGVCIAAGSVADSYRRSDVVFLPIDDLEPLPLLLVTGGPPSAAATLLTDLASLDSRVG